MPMNPYKRTDGSPDWDTFNSWTPEQQRTGLTSSDKYPDLNESFNLLSKGQVLPQFSLKDQPNGVTGAYYPATNKIEIDPQAGLTTDTVAHETTHALWEYMQRLANLLRKSATGIENSQIKQQYIDAVDKFQTPPQLPGNQQNQIKSPYRYSTDEQKAFGVGNFSEQQTPGQALQNILYPAPPHTDATNATEMAILRELANRTLNGKIK
jgi:hypothetical protein